MTRLQRLLDRLLCRLGCHDWRDMNGICRSCDHRDGLWGLGR